MTAAYKIEYLTYTLASSISDIGESPKVTNVDLVMKSSISENFDNRSGCKTIELPVRMFDTNVFMKNLERYRTCRAETALLPKPRYYRYWYRLIVRIAGESRQCFLGFADQSRPCQRTYPTLAGIQQVSTLLKRPQSVTRRVRAKATIHGKKST